MGVQTEACLTDVLFQPIKLGNLEVANRMAMAPLTRSRADNGLAPTEMVVEYYSQRASVGLIIAEATQVSETAQGYTHTPGIYTADQIAAWKKVTDAVHAQGGKIFVQLWHTGRMSHTHFQPGRQAPVAPSAIAAKAKTYIADQGFVDCSEPRALATAEIAGIVDDFRTAAAKAIEAGFDGVEIHGAHGYLIDAFLRDGSNHRTDAYGGGIENRARFLLEVMAAVIGEIGADRVGIRLSPVSPVNDSSESDPQPLFEYVVHELEKRHPVYIHVVEGHTGGPRDGEPFGPELDVTPDRTTMGRIAAQTFRQVMMQRLREVDREMKYEEYAGREGDIVTGIIQQNDARYTLLDLGRVEALLPQAEQVPYERPEPNSRLKAYIVEVRKTSKGPQIVVSRTHPGLIKRLFELEVPEIADGVVEIKACAREPGHRTKIAVWSNDPNVDPVGACVGARGARVRQVVTELRGEKIDIVPFSEDSQDLVAKALSPAKVKEVRIDPVTGTAEVIVPDYQLSLAIGKEGQNARLAARLTGWRVDIKSETQLAEEEAYGNQDWAEGEWVVDPESGEQVWQPAEGGPALSAEEWQTAAADQAAEGDAAPADAAADTTDGDSTDSDATDAASAEGDSADGDATTADSTDQTADAADQPTDEPADPAAPEQGADA